MGTFCGIFWLDSTALVLICYLKQKCITQNSVVIHDQLQLLLSCKLESPISANLLSFHLYRYGWRVCVVNSVYTSYIVNLVLVKIKTGVYMISPQNLKDILNVCANNYFLRTTSMSCANNIITWYPRYGSCNAHNHLSGFLRQGWSIEDTEVTASVLSLEGFSTLMRSSSSTIAHKLHMMDFYRLILLFIYIMFK